MTLVPNYVPTDWVDTVTPVDEAHMDKLDVAVDQHADAINTLDTRVVTVEGRPVVPTVVNGKWIKGVSGAMVWSDIAIADVATLQTSLNAKQDSSAKGAVNGYASLDSGGKVPTTQLPVSIDLRWAGAYSAATAYKEGDVVISNGVSYMALRPTTNETPAPWSTSAGGALTSLVNQLGADVTMTTANTFYDGPSLSLTAGTWLLIAHVSILNGGSAGKMTSKLWDGTTVIASIEQIGVGSNWMNVALAGIATPGSTTTYKFSVASAAASAVMKAAPADNATGIGATASTLVAVKIG